MVRILSPSLMLFLLGCAGPRPEALRNRSPDVLPPERYTAAAKDKPTSMQFARHGFSCAVCTKATICDASASERPYYIMCRDCGLEMASKQADPELQNTWRAVMGSDPDRRRKTLSGLDARIKQGMSENEVLDLFPDGALVKTPLVPGDRPSGSYLKLRGNLASKILGLDDGGHMGDYWIKLDARDKVISHMVICGNW